MGTKEAPGIFDCYKEAKPNEPMFVLLGRDPRAPALVRAWADASEARGTNPAKVAESRSCADAMDVYRAELAGDPLPGAPAKRPPCWGHADNRTPDRWVGAFESREAAIEDGREQYDASFWIQRGHHPALDSLVPDALDVIEQMADTARGEAGAGASEWPDVGKEGRAALEAMLERWAAKYAPAVTFWIADGEPECVEVVKAGVPQ